MDRPTDIAADAGPAAAWKRPSSRSLPEVHGTVPIPLTGGPWKKMMAFAGPGYLVAVGYMDPGNWATDLQGGARYGYTLLSVIMISNLMAILLQSLSARLQQDRHHVRDHDQDRKSTRLNSSHVSISYAV